METREHLMGLHTGIQYLDSDVSPTSGCDGCELADRKGNVNLCWAKQIHEKRLAPRMPGKYAASFFDVRTINGRVWEAAKWPDLRGVDRVEKRDKKGKIVAHAKPWMPRESPRVIGVSFMADALSADVSFDFLVDEVIRPVDSEHGRRHFFYWLTKQSKRLAEFDRYLAVRGIGWPHNLMMAASVTSRATTRRIGDLANTRAHLRGVSVEPILQWPIELGSLSGIHHVVIGGCSDQGDEARITKLEWIRDLRDQCVRRGVKCFIKQLGSRVNDENGRLWLSDSHGGDWNEWPKDLRVRDMPTGARQ